MNFDPVAAPYHWLETIVFGDQLQQARVAFMREMGRPRRALVIGEGDGRFLAEFVRLYPETPVDCIEASARMIGLAQRAAGAAPVKFIQADIGSVALVENSYDLIVTHFFLDCFTDETLPRLIDRLAYAATAESLWLIADFCHPPHGWRRWRARALIATMYSFFRAVAGIEARKLVDYRPVLRPQGFCLTKNTVSPNGMICSELWLRR